MITDIPTPSEFYAAGLNHLNLAWTIAIRAILDWEEHQDQDDTEPLSEVDLKETSRAYWTKSQPAMANALSLLLQAMEMGLKGRIAAVSPYLLISRDPKDWPGGIGGQPVAFGRFRTLDAGDLVKVHNIVSPSPLGDRFITFWDRVRVERNTLVHTASHPLIEPAYLVRSILTAAQALFSEMSWPKRLREMLDTDQYAALGLDDSNHNYVMRQIEAAVEYLEPAEARLFLGFDKGRRPYVCPSCYEQANRDWQSSWPKLAQLRSRAANETSLVCVVCEEVSTVERISCVREGCLGNVVKDGVCLTCVSAQDEPARSNSELDGVTNLGSHLYHFEFGRGRTTILDNGHYSSDEAAIEDVRRRMEAPHAKS